MKRDLTLPAIVAIAAAFVLGLGSVDQSKKELEAAARRQREAAAKQQRAADLWVQTTLKKMTLEEKIGQMLVPSLNAVYLSTDTEEYERLRHLVKDLKVGGIHVFGGGEAAPGVMLNPIWGGTGISRKGDPYEAAVLLNRLQSEAAVPLIATADFEGGAGYIINGATRLPRAMTIAATRDLQLAAAAGEVSAIEGRSLGVHVDFYPVVDVNNNPRNPIINIRSFGENVELVSEMARAYIRGVQSGGMLATAKHFPGHGDTTVDTHLGLAVIDHPRERLDAVELPPFKAAIDEGVDAVMSSHIVLPALDPTPGIPATLSRPILTGLLRDEMKFKGLVFTDSMQMNAITKSFGPEQAAVMAVKAGADFVLHSADDDAAMRGIKAAVVAGEISEAQITESVERILRAKAKLGLHVNRQTDLAAIATRLGGRAHQEVADTIAARALTLVKDDRESVPLKAPRTANVLYLSVVDYTSGWREGAPGRVLVPELKRRWPNLTAIEISDRTTASEFDLVRALARRADVVIAGIFVRIASYSGRMDLNPEQVALLESLANSPSRPLVSVLFGNPYVATFLPKLPAMLLTYEFAEANERAAAKALAGEISIGGKLPITLPEMAPFGQGLVRAVK